MRKHNDCKQRFTTTMRETKKTKNQETCAHATQTHVRSSCWDTENSSQRAKLFPGITSPQPIYETNGGGDSWQNFGPLGTTLCVPA